MRNLKKLMSLFLAAFMIIQLAGVTAASVGADSVKTVTVGVDNATQTKYLYGSSAPFQIHYWYTDGNVGDVTLNPTNQTVEKETPDNGYTTTFYLYSAAIPADAAGFKAHKGNNWFGDDADISVDAVYLYVYQGADKAFYEKAEAIRHDDSHTVVEVAEVPASPLFDGTKAHFHCYECDKNFADPDCTREVTSEELVIKYVAPEDGFYLAGPFSDWSVDESFRMVKNEFAGTDEYMYSVDLTTDSDFRIVWVKNGENTWIPDGMGRGFIIPEDGNYTVYFRPNFDGGDDWLYQCVYLELNAKPAVHKLGDADGNGEVDSVDATVVQRVATKLSVPYSEEQIMCADVDGDGSLTMVDATFIQRFVINLGTPYDIGAEIV